MGKQDDLGYRPIGQHRLGIEVEAQCVLQRSLGECTITVKGEGIV
jgi:hypothetical protein